MSLRVHRLLLHVLVHRRLEVTEESVLQQRTVHMKESSRCREAHKLTRAETQTALMITTDTDMRTLIRPLLWIGSVTQAKCK